MGISAVLITLNEETNIARSLESLAWTDEQIVVDAGSQDRTQAISLDMGARVYERPFENFETQKNYAASLAKEDWILSIDADEVVPPELAREIQEAARSNPGISGFRLKRQNYFLGRPLRHAIPDASGILRCFRRGKGRFSGLLHEKVVLEGPVMTLKTPLEHYSTRTLSDYFKKMKLYTELEARKNHLSGKRPSLARVLFFPPAKWAVRLFAQGGILDGWTGIMYHSLSCYYDWVRYWKARRIS